MGYHQQPAHTVADLSTPTPHRQETHVTVPMQTTDPTTLRGGLTASTAHLPRARVFETALKAHLCPADAEITTALGMPTQGYTSMGPLHLPANAEQAHHHNRNGQGNTAYRPPPLPQSEIDLQMRHLQEDHDTDDAVAARP
jgi:hypothetical protein